MSIEAQRTKLLIVDTSPSMAQVLKTFAETNGYDADVFSDSSMACQALNQRFSADINQSYDCVMLGWPEGKIGIIADLLGSLATADHADLPLIVFSQKSNADVMTLARRRSKTRSLLWKNHAQAVDIIESLVYREKPSHAISSGVAVTEKQKVLLVDNASTESQALRNILEANGYQVSLSNSALEARSALESTHFDLVVSEFFLRGESGELLCNYMRGMSPERRPVYAVMTNKNLDSVVQRSLSVGAITCLNKAEPTDILFARLDAIAKGLSSANKKSVVAKPTKPAVVAQTSVAQEAVSQAAVKKPVVPQSASVMAGIETTAPVASRTGFLNNAAIRNMMNQAIVAKSDTCFSVLMLDVKIVALATGDKMGVGGSAPMREIVQAKFQELYTRKNSIAYMDDGKFVFFFATKQAEQALELSKKLAELVPTMIDYLADTELVSYGAFLQLPKGQSEVTPRHMLLHCKAACARTEQDKLDNAVFVIDENKHLHGVTAATANRKSVTVTAKIQKTAVA